MSVYCVVHYGTTDLLLLLSLVLVIVCECVSVCDYHHLREDAEYTNATTHTPSSSPFTADQHLHYFATTATHYSAQLQLPIVSGKILITQLTTQAAEVSHFLAHFLALCRLALPRLISCQIITASDIYFAIGCGDLLWRSTTTTSLICFSCPLLCLLCHCYHHLNTGVVKKSKKL